MTDFRPSVLLVDDLEANLLAIEAQLARLNCDLVRVNSGNEALRQLLSRNFAVMLLDVQMPQMDGYEVARHARNHPSTRDVPIIFVTALDTEEHLLRGYGSGAVDYLFKPINPSILRSKVQVFLDLYLGRQRLTDEIEAHKKTMGDLEAASRVKSQFIANMSHELRTPLNAIIGFSELLEDEKVGNLSPSQKSCVQCVQQSGRHLLKLINDMLDLSKIEAGRMELAREPTSFVAIAGQVEAVLRPLVEKRGLTFVASIPEDLPDLSADPVRLKQILYNLLSNGIKFTPGGGAVRLEAQVIGGQLEVTVRDTGIGVRPEDLPLLFREFEQLNPVQRDGMEGTGLGLVLTKRLVELHGGSIAVASQLGQGSTFTVLLPLESTASTIDGHQNELSRHVETSTGVASGGARILVVEDDPPSRHLIREILKHQGHEILEAATFDEAKILLVERDPQLVVTDIRIPNGGGEQLLREIRQLPSLKHLPVLATAAHAMHGDRERLLAAGFDGYLSKPIDTREFGQAIESLLITTKDGAQK